MQIPGFKRCAREALHFRNLYFVTGLWMLSGCTHQSSQGGPAAISGAAPTSSASGPRLVSRPEPGESQYLVVVRDDIDNYRFADSVAALLNARIGWLFAGFNGFSLRHLSPSALERLRKMPEVIRAETVADQPFGDHETWVIAPRKFSVTLQPWVEAPREFADSVAISLSGHVVSTSKVGKRFTIFLPTDSAVARLSRMREVRSIEGPAQAPPHGR